MNSVTQRRRPLGALRTILDGLSVLVFFVILPFTLLWEGRSRLARAFVASLERYWLAWTWAITCVAVWATLTYEWAYSLSAFSMKLAMMCLAFTLVAIADKGALRGLVTRIELAKGNTAYAIVLSTLIVVVGLVVALS